MVGSPGRTAGRAYAGTVRVRPPRYGGYGGGMNQQNFETLAIHAGQDGGPRDRGRRPADLPGVDLQAGRRRRPARRLRVQPVGEPDAHRPGGEPRRAGGRPPRPGLRLRPGGGGLPAADPAQPRRPRGDPERRLRRHVPAVREGRRALGRAVVGRRHLRPGRGACRTAGPHEGDLGRDAVEPAAGRQRHRGAGRRRTVGRARNSSWTTPSPAPICSSRSRWARTSSCTPRRSTWAATRTSSAARWSRPTGHWARSWPSTRTRWARSPARSTPGW